MSRAPRGGKTTPPDAIRLQFGAADPAATARELRRRGLAVSEGIAHYGGEAEAMRRAACRSPHGVAVEFWGAATQGGACRLR